LDRPLETVLCWSLKYMKFRMVGYHLRWQVHALFRCKIRIQDNSLHFFRRLRSPPANALMNPCLSFPFCQSSFLLDSSSGNRSNVTFQESEEMMHQLIAELEALQRDKVNKRVGLLLDCRSTNRLGPTFLRHRFAVRIGCVSCINNRRRLL